jgi:hypothetical protein
VGCSKDEKRCDGMASFFAQVSLRRWSALRMLLLLDEWPNELTRNVGQRLLLLEPGLDFGH